MTISDYKLRARQLHLRQKNVENIWEQFCEEHYFDLLDPEDIITFMRSPEFKWQEHFTDQSYLPSALIYCNAIIETRDDLCRFIAEVEDSEGVFH